ncbi:MAG: GNAT family N-acetyltransferase [Chloroflexota bacterium]
MIHQLAVRDHTMATIGASPTLNITTATNVSTFAALRREWGDLLDDSTAGVFNSWEWLYPWYRRIGSERELHLLAARKENGHLLGLLPLSLEKRRAMGRTLRRLSFLGDTEVGSDYLDVIARNGQEVDVRRALLVHVRENGDWDVLDLLDMDSDSPTLDLLRELFSEEQFVIETSDGSICPYEQFAPGLQYDAFMKGTSRYDNFVRRRKWLEKQPRYIVERTTDPGELAGPMSDFMHLHAQRWAGEGGSQGITGPAVEAFHRDAAQFLAERNQLCLYTMRLGEKAVASVYGILHGGKFIYYQSGRDPEWQSKSVGLVLIGETFRHAFELGLQEYDFLRGMESYKADWVTQQRRTVSVRIYRKDGPGVWITRHEQAERSARSFAKKTLPAGLTQRLRRISRGEA